jgi:hypothetical protein
MKKNLIIAMVLLLILAIGVSAGYLLLRQQGGNKPPAGGGTAEPASQEAGTAAFNFSLTKPVFAQIKNQEAAVSPQIPAYQLTARELANLDSFKKVGINLTQAQLKSLETPGFFLAGDYPTGENWPNQDDFVDLYNTIQGPSSMYLREPQNTVFITSDAGLHLFHVLIDRSFQKTEETKFQPLLTDITKTLFKDSIGRYHLTVDPDLKASYRRLAVYYLIPLAALETGSAKGLQTLEPDDFKTYAEYVAANDKQLKAAASAGFQIELPDAVDGLNIDGEILDLASQEIALINQASDVVPSPLFSPLRPDFRSDYTQFKPRSHYTKNAILKSYFVAMMWYGRMGFTLNSADLTRDALIITGQVNSLNAGDKKIGQLWSDMSSAIEFFVGESDDMTPYQYTKEIEKIYGNSMTEAQLTDKEMLNRFVSAAVKDLPGPRILSEVIQLPGYDSVSKDELLKQTMQFRLMGQRFTPDAEVLNRLTQGDESPDPAFGQKLPSTPTALMVASILHPTNPTVKSYLDGWVNDPVRIAAEGRQSDKVIGKIYGQLATEFAGYDDATWTQNIYWGWLNGLRALLADYGSGYPAFMTGTQWQQKNLETVLGSYTELKHDTLLYAKQSYAELGGGGPDEKVPPVVKGYVEPNLIFWNRLLSLAQATRDGLASRNVLPQEYAPHYSTLINALTFIRDIAAKELANQQISDDDFEKLRTLASSKFAATVNPPAGEELTLREKRAGLITDIHTDARRGQILYEATGKPYLIYVAVKDANGTRLTRGVVYRHYELTNPLTTRLTDEDWQAKVYGEAKLPPEDGWSAALVK